MPELNYYNLKLTVQCFKTVAFDGKMAIEKCIYSIVYSFYFISRLLFVPRQVKSSVCYSCVVLSRNDKSFIVLRELRMVFIVHLIMELLHSLCSGNDKSHQTVSRKIETLSLLYYS